MMLSITFALICIAIWWGRRKVTPILKMRIHQIAKKNSEENDIADIEKNEVTMPSNYIFPSFFTFMMCGPFVCADKRLSVFLTDDRDKSTGTSRKTARINAAKEKKMEHDTDTLNARGLTTDQRIDLATLDVHRQAMLDRKKESTVVALAVEDNALNMRIQAAEKRAQMRCPEYDKDDANWIRVDKLQAMQDKLMNRMMDENRKINEVTAIDLSLEKDNDSPTKKRAAEIDDTESYLHKKVSLKK